MDISRRAITASALFAIAIWTARATPVLQARQEISALSPTQISSFRPFTYFASAAYCRPPVTLTWSCGANCDANPGFLPTASGGDGSLAPFWYVGFSPEQDTVIVGYHGTTPSNLVDVLTDLDFFLMPLNPTLFPGIDPGIEVHSGFADSHARVAPSILAAVQQTLDAHNAHSVTVVGHSSGAALALLDTVYLPLHIGPGISFRMIGYGLPRVGNQLFADYVDAHATLTHINNREDLIPTLPPLILGFHHPSGEVHIQDSGEWAACPGQDNPSTQCIVGDVPIFLESNLSDHDGPYDGVTIGC